jgi:hypothetical protein
VDERYGTVCDAYPLGIPLRLLAGLDGDHRQPRGDEAGGIVFEPAIASTSATPVHYWVDFQEGKPAGIIWAGTDGHSLGYAGVGEQALWRRRALHDEYRREVTPGAFSSAGIGWPEVLAPTRMSQVSAAAASGSRPLARP